MYSESVEDYLKALLCLAADRTEVPTSRLAQDLDVAPASVTGMLKKLARLGLVEHRRYHGARLTETGRAAATAVVRRHRLAETFLVETLGITPDRVHPEAHRWEHALSEEVERRLDAYLGYPTCDPHGAPIPRDTQPVDPAQSLLSQLGPGEQARVIRVADREDDRVRYIHELGLVPGAYVTVRERRPFAGPFTLAVGEANLIVGNEVTDHVIVARRYDDAIEPA